MKPPIYLPTLGGHPISRMLVAFVMTLACATPFTQAQDPKLRPMRGVSRGQPAPQRSTLVIAVNEIGGGISEPGWPLVVSVATISDDSSSAIPIPAGLSLKLTDESGRDTGVSLEPVVPPAGNTDNTIRYWLAAETTTTRLTPRRYRVAATPSNNLPGWRLEPGEFQILAPSPDRNRLLAYIKIERANVLGQHDEALAEANRILAANDKEKHAWIMKGDILMLKDDPNAALQAFDRALTLHQKTEREPIAIQARRRDAFLRSLEKRGVVPAQKQP